MLGPPPHRSGDLIVSAYLPGLRHDFRTFRLLALALRHILDSPLSHCKHLRMLCKYRGTHSTVLQAMKYILVSGGVVSGIGKGVIGTHLFASLFPSGRV